MRMKRKPTILGGCCIWCMLYFGVCCTLVYVVLDVCCTQSHLMIMTWRDREQWLDIVFCDDGRVVNEKERDAGWRWEHCGGLEPIWEIRGTTSLLGVGRTWIRVITCRIGTHTCCIGDGYLTHRRNSLKSQCLMIISLISSHLSLSHPQLYNHLKTWS